MECGSLMTNTNVRVKVKVADLLNTVRTRRAGMVAANDKMLAAEAKRLADWQRRAHAAIDVQVVDKYDSIPNWSPARLESLSDIDRDVRLLELCADEALIITATSGFARYL